MSSMLDHRIETTTDSQGGAVNLFAAAAASFGSNGEDYSSINRANVLVSPNEKEYELLTSKIRDLVEMGRGETIYEMGISADSGEIGLAEDELEASVATLQSICDILEADCNLLRSKPCEAGRKSVQYLIRKRADTKDFMEIRVAVVGNVDAGKSTLLGVLTHGELDNGRGHARQKLFRHKHEAESGRTSSVGNDILGFDSHGTVVNRPDHGSLDWVKVCENSSKVITFIDLAGHERYLKTTVFGMTGHAPDFGMLMVGANAGIVGMTKEHLGLALALSVPVFVVVTKIDMCPPNVLQETLKLLVKILKSPGCRKVPVMVKTADDVVLSATNFVSERLCPIFQVSNVTGENMEFLKMFLNLLSTRSPNTNSEPAEFQIDDTYSVPGVGTVVSGTTLRGTVRANDSLLLGPDPLGHFSAIAVKSIHRKRMPVTEVKSGQTASFSLKKIKRSQIRKGMVMVAPQVDPQCCYEFEGEILVLHHPTTISTKYQAMVHCGSIRQTASIIRMSSECLRTGDKAQVLFRFVKHPEYLKEGQRLVFREGRTKAVGNVNKIIPYVPAVQKDKAKHAAAKLQQSVERKVEANMRQTRIFLKKMTSTAESTVTRNIEQIKMDVIEQVKVDVFVLATNEWLTKDRDNYHDHLEEEEEAVVSVDKMWISTSGFDENKDFVGKYLPAQIKLNTKVPEKWKNDAVFRKDLFDKINKKMMTGMIVDTQPID